MQRMNKTKLNKKLILITYIHEFLSFIQQIVQ
jgi:hypothetical protein